MREEEKLARDVYLILSQIWDCPVFVNISAAEQRHMDAIGLLVTKYHLEDPVGEDVPGVFQDGHLASLYADLILEIEGQTSLLEALDVGRRIEEEDIADLNAALQEITARDVEWVFGNLLRGSTNHLSAFTRLIANGGLCPATTCWRQAAARGQRADNLAYQARGGRGGKGKGGQGNGIRQRKRDGSGQQDRQRKRDGSCTLAATI
jgi:hypothetical protein